MITTLSLIKRQMDDAWTFVESALEDVDDDMLHWEPAPGCWGLRLKDGRWRFDYHIPDPIPSGPKTIGWLVSHLATCKEMHHHFCFGSGEKDWDDLIIPGDASSLKQYLAHSHGLLRGALDGLKETDLERAVGVTGRPQASLPLWQALWFDIHHDYEHGGQIFQVKNEYKNTHRPE